MPGSILLAGATGLVGNRVLRRLLDWPGATGTVVAPVRRPLTLVHPRLRAPVLDFALGEEDFARALEAAEPGRFDVFACCLGTTLRAAGSREAFIAVDRELALRMSRIARARGARHAILVSSVGASRQSGNFYLRVKGEVEDAFEQSGSARSRPGRRNDVGVAVGEDAFLLAQCQGHDGLRQDVGVNRAVRLQPPVQ